MTNRKIPAIIFYMVFVLFYLLTSTNFKKGWIRKSVSVKGTKVSLLVFVLIALLVLVIVIIVPM